MEKSDKQISKNASTPALTKAERSNKISINMIKLLIPNLEKSFYLNIIINESANLKTKLLDFKKGNVIELNQIFDLDGSIQSIENIKFNLFEKNSIFSNIIYKGEYNNKDKSCIDKTTNCNLCFLSNNDKQNCIVIYFRYELSHDLIENFDENLKNLNDSMHIKTKTQKSTLENLMDVANGENAANFSKFVKNMEYLKILNNEFVNILYWKNKWKSFSIAIFISLGLLFSKFIFCLGPIFLIFLHVYNRKNLSDFSFKDKSYDNLENMNFITKTIEFTNFTFELYENFITAIQHCEKNIIEDIYLNLIKLIFFNFFIIYSRILTIQLILNIFLVCFWAFILWNLPPFQAFCKFLFNFMLKNFLNMNQNSFRLYLKNYFYQQNKDYLGLSKSVNNSSINHLTGNYILGINFMTLSNESKFEKTFRLAKELFNLLFVKLFALIPFARLILCIVTYDSSLNVSNINETENNSCKNNSKSKFDFNDIFKNINNIAQDPNAKQINLCNDISNDLSCKTQTLKYEIYENERWWMFVGWTKNLIGNERPIWSDISGKNYLDFKSVFLPGVNYEWIGNWTVELTDKNDNNGWEYASDFNSQFSLTNFSKYVRKRKWVRYAKMVDN